MTQDPAPANSDNLGQIRSLIRKSVRQPEQDTVGMLLASEPLTPARHKSVSSEAAKLVEQVRISGQSGLMERFLGQYGLDTDEGVALMCLAEAYLRTPDSATLDDLITDKIGGADWARHLGRAQSSLVNASTWALMLTGRVFRTIPAEAEDLTSAMHGVVQRLGEPVARAAISEAMKLMGRQFVLGRDIGEAVQNAEPFIENGDLASFDMLGEAARTEADAKRYFLSYAHAIAEIAKSAKHTDPHRNSGISVKLSALHPRYETPQKARVMDELVPRLAALASHAKAANIPLAVDAEEADRLDLSLDVIEAALCSPDLQAWQGFGMVVQAYSKRCLPVLDWCAALANKLGRQVSVRLVKGAYWDAEIKLAQTLGLEGYPVFTRKENTDLSYIVAAKKLLSMGPEIFPQFATHNAHTMRAITQMAAKDRAYEFQRLHGMGETLHEAARTTDGITRRIYAPVGVHQDLLAYLVRRLLENGANSSFVNQLQDAAFPASEIAADPIAKVEANAQAAHPRIPLPPAIYEGRENSRGWDINEPADAADLGGRLKPFKSRQWAFGEGREVANPAKPSDVVGSIRDHSADEAAAAVSTARAAFAKWAGLPVRTRGELLCKVADLYEENAGELMALTIREAGKTHIDAVAELREAVDFLRYYSQQAQAIEHRKARGPILCISPWNFPLAIFTGQIAGALATGNTVVAKPAEDTPLIAARAHALFLEAGVPGDAFHLVQGTGAEIGPALTGHPDICGTLFTGSTQTARHIDVSMAQANPGAPLVAETGGVNAMIVDSTALAEQAVRDIVASAFQSAGQRCSALRLLVLQKEVAPRILEMLEGALVELRVGDPWEARTDVGPIITAAARDRFASYIEARADRILFRHPHDGEEGHFLAPTVLSVDAIGAMEEEIFGPVLHVTTFAAEDLDATVDAINALGYGLTLGIHSRIDARVDRICARASVGNIYVNRNQIGAVVGVQPFGGEGLSGTGPKAGGPHYLYRLTTGSDRGPLTDMELDGPTGERNSWTLSPRGIVACLGPGDEAIARQKEIVVEAGALPVAADPDGIATVLAHPDLDLVISDAADVSDIRQTLASREGRRVPLARTDDAPRMVHVERTISEDTTASGGNASLLAST